MSKTEEVPLFEPGPISILLLCDGPEAACLPGRLEAACGAVVTAACDLPHCLQLLERQSFQLLLLEDSIAATDSATLDAIYDVCGSTLLVEVNFATANQDRVVRQARSALKRRARCEEQARLAATSRLRDELSGPVAGLLLQSQLLLARRESPGASSLQQIAEVAESLSRLLRMDAEVAGSTICIP